MWPPGWSEPAGWTVRISPSWRLASAQQGRGPKLCVFAFGHRRTWMAESSGSWATRESSLTRPACSRTLSPACGSSPSPTGLGKAQRLVPADDSRLVQLSHNQPLTPQGPPDGSGGARGRATGVAGSPHASRGCRRRHVRVNTTACTRPLERWAANPLALVAAGSSTMCWAESAHPRPRRRGAAGWMARATRKGTCGQTRAGAAAAWTGRRFSPACGDGSTRAANKISSVHSSLIRVHFAHQSGVRWTPRARPPA